MAVHRHSGLPDVPGGGATAPEDQEWIFAALLGESERPAGGAEPAPKPDKAGGEPGALPHDVIEGIAEAACVVSGGRVAAVNQALSRLSGYSRDHLLGLDSITNLVTNEPASPSRSTVTSGAGTLAVLGSDPLPVVISRRHIGHEGQVLLTLRRGDGTEEPPAIALLAAMLDANPQPAAAVNHEGVVQLVNRAFSDMAGIAAGAARDLRLGRLVHTDDAAALRAVIGAAFGAATAQPTTSHSFRMRQRDGQWVAVEARSSLLPVAGTGQPLALLGLQIIGAGLAVGAPAPPVMHPAARRLADAARSEAGDDVFLEAARVLLGNDAATAAPAVLALAGQGLEARRMALLIHEAGDEPGDMGVAVRYQWAPASDPGVLEPENTVHHYGRTLPRWSELGTSGDSHAGHVSQLPEGARAFFSERGIASFLVAPVHCGGEFRGLLLAEAGPGEREWSTAGKAMAASLARGLGTAIQRDSVEHIMRTTLDQYRQLVEDASDVIYTTDIEGRFTWANRAMTSLTGYSLDALRTMYLSQIVTPEHERVIDETAMRLLEEGSDSLSYEVEGVSADGVRFTLELNMRAGFEGGRPVRIHGIGRDVTKRRQAEDLFKAVANNARVGMYIVVDSRFKFVNPQFASLTGYSEEELLGRSILDIVLQSDRPRVRKIADAQLATGRGQPYEYEIVRKDGERRWVMESITAITYDGSQAALGNFMDITERKQAEEHLSRQAFEDALTGLPNRAAFLDELGRALRDGNPAETLGLLYIDLDGFKAVNDMYGHEAGDELLVFVGQRIRECVRPEDAVARLGGDEFTVLLQDLRTHADAEVAAARIVQTIEQPFLVDGREVRIGASVGISTSSPGQTSGRELLRSADAALYRAKAGGKNRFERSIDDWAARVA